MFNSRFKVLIVLKNFLSLLSISKPLHLSLVCLLTRSHFFHFNSLAGLLEQPVLAGFEQPVLSGLDQLVLAGFDQPLLAGVGAACDVRHWSSPAGRPGDSIGAAPITDVNFQTRFGC